MIVEDLLCRRLPNEDDDGRVEVMSLGGARRVEVWWIVDRGGWMECGVEGGGEEEAGKKWREGNLKEDPKRSKSKSKSPKDT